jgi:hypothetical protein
VAASEDELRHSLGLYTHMTSGHGKPMENPWKTHGKPIVPCSLIYKMVGKLDIYINVYRRVKTKHLMGV